MLYSEKLVQAAKEVESDRVQLLNIWRYLVNTALDASGKATLEERVRLDADLVAEKKFPGCGLNNSEQFPEDFFVDGLHFDGLVCCDLFKDLMTDLLGVRGCHQGYLGYSLREVANSDITDNHPLLRVFPEPRAFSSLNSSHSRAFIVSSSCFSKSSSSI
jgi:hypothetical protein